MTSHYAPAERATPESLLESREALLLDPFVNTLLETIPYQALILNQQRQILAANAAFLNSVSSHDLDQILGQRPGEAFRCIFSKDEVGGCGTSKYCAGCGLVKAVLETQQRGRKCVYECHLTVGGPDAAAADFEVTSVNATISGIPVTIVTLRDITGDKRVAMLEKIFFHDIMNSIGGIHGIATVLAEKGVLSADKEQEYKKWLVDLINQMVLEIKDQRRLLQAERGDFKPAKELIPVSRILREIQALYANHDVAKGIDLVIADDPQGEFVSDSAVVRRILGNMVKNALEASTKGDTVTISCKERGADLLFSIHNKGVIPPEISAQLFQRSVSSKSLYDRGIGMHSIKLFGEQYLNGRVTFTSREGEGTTFTLTLPRNG